MESSTQTGEDDLPSIFQIIYHSNIVVEGGSEAIMTIVKAILAWSRSWNRKHGITGALLLNDQNFVQVLEGPSHAVKALYGHIACDRRHKNIHLLHYDFIWKREFTAWAMAYIASARGPVVQLASDPLNPGTRTNLTADRVLHLMRGMLERDRVPAPGAGR